MIAPQTSALGHTYAQMPEPTTSTVVTAEIPAVPAGPTYGVLLPDGSIWYPGSRKRLPAPLALRIVVWALAFLVLLAAAGDFVIHSHPGWVDTLRRHVPAAALGPVIPAGGGQRPTTHSSTPAQPSVSLTEEYPQPAGLPAATTAYSVSGTSTYTVLVKATALTYMHANNLVNGQDVSPPLFAGYIQAGQTQTINATGPVDVQVDAGGTTVSVMVNGKVVGTAAKPPYVPWDFWFQPATKA
jgi:hypothetical protein